MSKSTDHDEDEGEFIDAEEYLQHVLMNETKAYFDRGRRFESIAKRFRHPPIIAKKPIANPCLNRGLSPIINFASRLRLCRRGRLSRPRQRPAAFSRQRERPSTGASIVSPIQALPPWHPGIQVKLLKKFQ
jgi:hypothetical protein